MVCDTFNAQSLLTYQLQPSLVLDHNGTVLATTQSSRRLIISTDFEPDPLVGQHISSLGLAIQPGTTTVRTWDDLLYAAHTHNTSEYGMYPPVDTGNPEASGENDAFWDEEAAREGTLEINVFVARQQDISSIVQARATICWLPENDQGYFLVTFSRTSLPHISSHVPSSVRARGSIEFFSYSVQDDHSSVRGSRDFVPQNGSVDPELKAPVLSPMDIAAPMIPHFTATLDLHGQVTRLSQEWYDFTGLTEEESLGNGWYATLTFRLHLKQTLISRNYFRLTAIHPSDTKAVTSAWTDVLRNKRQNWTHQAQYRKAADGKYYWFLIRAEPEKDANGTILRWNATTMDIHDWVMARLEADRQRQAMLTLLSQTDVMLWGVDALYHMYICEGRLDWNPAVVIDSFIEEGIPGDAARVIGTHDDENRRKMVLALRSVLQGDESNPIVEHWEGNRYFRTRFVAERAASGGGIEACLALTFDITDEKARSSLQVENQRLLDNEKVALEANKLKGGFLANVTISQIKAYFQTDFVDVTRDTHPYLCHHWLERTPARL